MRNIDIYRADNYLIPLGWILVIPSLLVVLFQLPGWVETLFREGLLTPPPLTFPFILLGGVASLVTGQRIRSKEKMINGLLNSLSLVREADARDLTENMGISREELAEAIRVINTRGYAFFLWDRENDIISDGRLSRKSVYVDSCRYCGHDIGEYFPLKLSPLPACPYCGSVLDLEDIHNQRDRVFHQMDREHETGNAFPLPREGEARTFSLPIFVILVIFFWPAALFYIWLIYRGGKRS